MNQSDFKLKYAGANNGIIVKTNSSETKLDTSNYEITKKTYIPLEFAESTINALNEDRIDIKNRLEERIRQYQEKILTMEREYKAIIIELRDNAKRHIEVQDLIRKKIEQEKDLQIENLNETIKTLKQEHLEVVDELYKKLRQLELDYHEMCDKFTDVNIEKECLTALYEIKLEIQGSLISELQSNIANENVMLEDFRVRYRNEIENFEREIKYLKEQLVIRTSAFQDYKDKSIQDVVGLLLNDVIHKIEVAAARQEIANVSIVDDTLKDGIIASITESLSSARQEIENLLEEKNLRMEVNSSILDVLSKVELQDQDSKMALYSDLQEKYAALEYEYQLLIDLNSSLNRELLDAKTDDTPKSPTVRFQDSPIASPSQRGLLTRGLSKTIDDNDKLLFEQLQDDYVELQEELEKVVQETTKKIAELEDECNFAKQQLENLTVEKRTDIVKKYEEEIIALRQSVSKQSEELSAKKADIFRLEKRIEELQHRALSAEEEIKERDAQELAKLNTNEEKAQLRIKLNKQRDEIILKSKAVTAGWDAAAKADERVEVEVEKAYYRGFQEGKEQHTDDMKSLNDAIELKENRLTELVVKLNEMESRVREADLSSEKYRQEAENAKKETSDTISMFMSLQESMQSNSKSETTDEVVIGHTNDEFESLQSTLDKAHDEIISITDRYDQLSQKLELSEQRVSTYVRLLSLERQRLTDTLSKVESKQNTNSTVSLSKMSKELEDVINLIQATIQQGSALWKNNKREECFDLYLQAHDNLAKKLSNYRDLQEIVQSKAKLARSQVQAKPRDKPRAVEVLKQSMDKVVKSIVEKYGTSSVVSDTLVVTQNQQFPRNEVSDSLLTEIRELETQVAVLEKLYDPKTASKTEDSQINVEDEMKPPIDEVPTATDVETPLVSLDLPVGNESQPPAEVPLSPVTEAPIISDEASKMTSILQRAKDAEEMVEKLKKQIAVILSTKTDDAEDSTKLTNANPTTSRREKMMEAAEIRKLQKKIRELELQVQHFKSQVSSGNAVTDKKALLATEKQYQRKLKDLESQSKKDIQILESKNIRLEKSLETTNMMLDPITKERDLLRAKVTDMDLMSQELTVFRNKEKDFIVLQEDYSTKCSEYDILLEQFKKENNLRKKYKNELEDLKGAVRVFARCRPMAGYEIERGCKQVVQFKDEFSMKLFTSRGERDYEFDAVFGPDSKQEQVFEDAKRLVESCIDGYNTSIFAYGQVNTYNIKALSLIIVLLFIDWFRKDIYYDWKP